VNINIKAKIEKYSHIYNLDRVKHPILTSDICHYILCATLDILLQQLDLNTPLPSDIKNNHDKLCSIFLDIFQKNNFTIDGTEQIENVPKIINQFIHLVINIIVHKGKKDKSSILITYQLYVNVFKNNLSNEFKNKLNLIYNNFKEFTVNNIISNHFLAINTFINNFINNLEHNTIWV
jgi:hypothetical protein